MKLEVGMWVRTKKGEIDKINQISVQEDNPVFMVLNNCVTFKNTILKASHNIIDLLEVGDYVNGHKVDVISVWSDMKELICNDYNFSDSAITLKNEDIKSVLTHEQFESMKYKIGANE